MYSTHGLIIKKKQIFYTNVYQVTMTSYYPIESIFKNKNLISLFFQSNKVTVWKDP
jgi:hypothetical protein